MMNEADVAFALNHCTRLRPCEECPLYKDGYFSPSRNACRAKLIEEAFDLINRQKAEIDMWKEGANHYQNLWCKAEADAQEERAEPIKQFAERLKATPLRFREENTIHWNEPPITKMVLFIDDSDIDNLVKEMTGE